VKNNLLKNGFYNALSGLIRIGLALLTIPILIRIIGVEEYGLWTLAYAVIVMVGLAEAGLATTTTVFVSQDLEKDDVDGLSQTLTVSFGAMFVLATLAGIALYFGSEPVVSYFPKLGESQQLSSVQALQIGGLIVWARLLQQVLVGVEQAYQRYDLTNMLNTAQSLLFSLGMIVVAWLGGKTVALMQWQAAATLAVLFSHVLVVWLLVRGLNLRLIWDRKKGLAVARYSTATWLASLGGVIFTQVDRLIVGALLGTTVLGVYAAITNITMQINTFSALPIQPMLPVISSFMVKQSIDQEMLQRQVKQALQINCLVALGMGSLLLILAPLVLHFILGGSPSSETVFAFRIATTIYALYSVNAVGFYVLFGANAVTECMIVQLVSGCFSLLLIAIGANTLGFLGAILGNSGYLGVWLLTFFGMKKLDISTSLWMKWINFPLLCFVSIVLLSILISDKFFLKASILTLQSVILSVWFIAVQPNTVKLISQKFFIR
jgi:O-antigen/teichoic acid export membrane protein